MAMPAFLGSQEHGRETRDYHGFEGRLLVEGRCSGGRERASRWKRGGGWEAEGLPFLPHPRRLFVNGREADVLRSSCGDSCL